jgi:hypothetical protein
MSEVAVDLAQMRQIKEREEKLLEELSQRLYRAQNVDELHIEIDVLAQTPNGVHTLKERLYKLKARFALAKNHAKKLDQDFEEMKPKLKELRTLMELQQKEEEKDQVLQFELSRYEKIHHRI